mmetsp:Transcript_1468/g.3947  ORF Transcript_1468/g.3947 Transcript_1468/m.3947 type:complete len:208 (-) Transcript_1468:806-1429(-)
MGTLPALLVREWNTGAGTPTARTWIVTWRQHVERIQTGQVLRPCGQPAIGRPVVGPLLCTRPRRCRLLGLFGLPSTHGERQDARAHARPETLGGGRIVAVGEEDGWQWGREGHPLGVAAAVGVIRHVVLLCCLPLLAVHLCGLVRLLLLAINAQAAGRGAGHWSDGECDDRPICRQRGWCRSWCRVCCLVFVAATRRGAPAFFGWRA